MACEIEFKDRTVRLNNRQFSTLIAFAIEIAECTVAGGESVYLDRMKELNHSCFWPGRGIDIQEDFPDLDERKFWSRVFLDTARAIFDRSIGHHDHSFWQVQAIYQAHGTGLLFEYAVRESERQWSADSIDRREFSRVVNGQP